AHVPFDEHRSAGVQGHARYAASHSLAAFDSGIEDLDVGRGIVAAAERVEDDVGGADVAIFGQVILPRGNRQALRFADNDRLIAYGIEHEQVGDAVNAEGRTVANVDVPRT